MSRVLPTSSTFKLLEVVLKEIAENILELLENTLITFEVLLFQVLLSFDIV